MTNAEVVSIDSKKKKKLDPEYWQKQAALPNARTIICNVPETYPLVELAKAVDQGIRKLRNGLISKYPIEKAVPLMEAYNQKIIELEGVVAEICRMVNMQFYKTPRVIKQLKKKEDNG